jgi:signal transduction histidine kinase
MYHKLLQRQLKKYGQEELLKNPHFNKFIEAVNDSYCSYEKDKELSEHSFRLSQDEFAEINRQLKDEVEVRMLSIERLKGTLHRMKPGQAEETGSVENDLLETVEIINQAVARRKEAEEQLRLAKEQAEKASHAKSDFLSVMSHEIRTPLNAVIGMGHLLLKNNPRADQLENLTVLKTSADNLLVLINDILDFSKIEAGRLELEETQFNLHKLVADIVTANKNNANERQNSLSLLKDDSLPVIVKSDSLRIGQVLNNLVSNAIKFTKQGSVEVKLKVKEKSGHHCVVTFSVEDTGIGIEPEKLRTIFQPFTQASTSITRQFGGTGLGLTITKSILELLGSKIHAASEKGRGSCFYFDLPLQVVQKNDQPAEKEVPLDFDLSGKKILLVEDTLFNVMFATQLLEEWKATVEVAENGQEAVEKTRLNNYDLILMDLQMPVMDGYTATVRIREFNKAVPIVALTASATSNVREKVIQAGMQDYVTKPFNPDDFLVRLKKYMRV